MKEDELFLCICPERRLHAHLIFVLHETERLLSVGSVDHHGLSTDTGHAATTAARSQALPVMVMVMVAMAAATKGRRLLLLPVGLYR